MNNAVMFSSGSDYWTTPQDLFDELDAEFHFTLDAAAERDTAKCELYFGPDHVEPAYRDALSNDWFFGREYEAVFCNPPYSRGWQAAFIAKAAEQAQKWVGLRLRVVMLLPARTDTKAFHRHIWDADFSRPRPGVEVRFLPGRLRFGKSINSAPFPSMVVVFRGSIC